MMQKISEIDDAEHDCANCDGDGWVCEDHPEVPFEKCCGGAGMPCTCNPLSQFEGQD